MVDRARALSFGAVADGYDRHRPGPPAEIAEWIVPAGARRAVDVAAGTGALSAALVGLVAEVVAVEPDRRMLAVAARRAPHARRVAGTAEALPLADASADVVGVSSAWHWVDEHAALVEAARVLRPGGVLAIVWSGADRSEGWVADVLDAGRRAAPSTGPEPTGPDGAGDRWRRPPDVPPGVPLAKAEVHRVATSVAYRTTDLPGLTASYSGVITLPDAERTQLLDTVAATVASHPQLAGRTTVELPIRATAYRLRRTA